jgi:hypothetical protein
MTSVTDIVNFSLQQIGTRTTVTDAELTANSTNEAIQANLILEPTRDQLLRMAPWDCALKTANLTYITSVPGTPENTSPATTLWTPGQPAPPWAYEYQYPVDCLRACYIIPAQQTGFSDSIPITTAVTGGAARLWNGPPIRYKVQIDTFVPVTAAVVANGGTGHAVGDVITLASGATTSAPIGAPVKLLVLTAPAGVIGTVSVITQLNDSAVPFGGSYFAAQTNPVAQGSTTGAGIGATFTLTFGSPAPQRVILTNQEYATLSYVAQVTDPNIMDPLFQNAWTSILAASLAMALTGDKKLANGLIASANSDIELARGVDGNEGLTINDITPDWIRARGIDFDSGYTGMPNSYDWGGLYPMFI